MENKEIIECNKLIAEFMGAYHCNDDVIAYPEGYWMSSDDFDLPYLLEDFEYHTSWDWLMPVVEKIKKLEFEFNTFSDYTKTEKYRNEVRISELSVNKYCRILIRNVDMLDAVYKAVVEFIKWHNENKTK